MKAELIFYLVCFCCLLGLSQVILKYKKVQNIIFYGSLDRNAQLWQKLGIAADLCYVQDVVLTGSLYDLGSYPGFVNKGIDAIPAGLHVFYSDRTLEILDAYEDYNPADPVNSLYIRKVYQINGESAWIYIYNRDPGSCRKILKWKKEK